MKEIKDRMKVKNKQISMDMKKQSQKNAQQIHEEKVKEYRYKADRRKIIQQNLLNSHEVVNQFWEDKLNGYQQMKYYQIDKEQNEIDQNQRLLQQLEHEELELIEMLEKKQNKQIKAT